MVQENTPNRIRGFPQLFADFFDEIEHGNQLKVVYFINTVPLDFGSFIIRGHLVESISRELCGRSVLVSPVD